MGKIRFKMGKMGEIECKMVEKGKKMGILEKFLKLAKNLVGGLSLVPSAPIDSELAQKLHFLQFVSGATELLRFDALFLSIHSFVPVEFQVQVRKASDVRLAFLLPN